jgi:glycosyltransferase involved in cell wall biosynthesis
VIRLNLRSRFTRVRILPALWNLFAKPWLAARAMANEHSQRDYRFVLFETIEEPLILRLLPSQLRARAVVRLHACMETEVVVWGKGIVLGLRRHLIGHVLRRHVQFIAATSRHYIGFVRKWYLGEDELLIASKRFCVVENSPPAIDGHQRRGFSKKGRVEFLTLGRMDWQGANQKGFDDILLAVAHLGAEVRSRIRLTIIGEGAERGRLMRIAASIGGVQVEFIQALPNEAVRAYLREVDCVVLASRYEGMSVFALEALASGCPVIFSDAGGIADLVDRNGYRFPAGDSRALSECIEKLVGLTDEQLHVMSERSLQIARGLTPAAAAERLLEFVRLIDATAPGIGANRAEA